MHAENALPPEANLSGRAAKLLIHLMRRNGEKTTNAELMRGSGVTDPATFFRAKKELKELGYLQNPIGIFQGVGETLSAISNYYAEPNRQNPSTREMPTREMPSVVPTYATNDAELTAQREPQTPMLIVPQFAEESEWRSEAMHADLMEMGEKTNQRNTPFWLRRQEQMRVLQGAWKEMFGKELTNDAAKDLLNLAEESVEEVLDAMEATKARGNIQSPLGYIRSTFRNRRDEARKAPSVRPVSIDKPGSSSAGSDSISDDNYYRPTPPDVQRKIDKLRALGLLQEEDDD